MNGQCKLSIPAAKKFLSSILLASLVTVSVPAVAAHLVTATLPSVDSYFDGIAVATQYDQFYGYSSDLMTQLQTEGHMSASYGVYDFASGTGGLDVLLYTGATGQDNQNVGPGGAFDFENPVHNPNGSATSFEGWWGQNDQDNNAATVVDHQGPVTVGQVHDYLHAIDPDNDIPVFYADLNQTGASPGMSVSVNASIIDTMGDLDPLNDVVVASWAMDGLNNSIYDPYVYADIPGTLTVSGDSGHVYNVDFNKGSGHSDFIFYAPEMDLSLYNNDYLFVMEGKLDGLNNGFEEFFLTGAVVPGGLVPTPGAPWLLAMGLAGMALVRRRISGRQGDSAA